MTKARQLPRRSPRPISAAGMGSVKSVTFEFLRSRGLTTAFGNPGSTELGFLRGWPDDFRYVLGLQEASVVGMADGYAQATGGAALVSLHSAAGVGNALGAIFTAYRNQSPLLIIAGQQARSLLPLRPFLGATSASEFPKPYVKWSCEPARAQDVPIAIAQAYHTAMLKPCGPAFVSVPSDDWDVAAEPVWPQVKSRQMAPDRELLLELAKTIERSRHPVLVLGAAVERDGAYERAIRLAERMACPVWAAPMVSRRTFPEDHPLFAGFLPACPERLIRALADYDLILVLGAPIFTFHVPGKFTLPRGAVVHITDDADAVASAPMGTSILATLGSAIAQLVSAIAQRSPASRMARAAAPAVAAGNPVAAEYVMQCIAEARGANSVILEEAPSHRHAMQRYLPMRRGDEYYAMASGGLGFALPAAVGVALARPSRRVICIIGDGAAMYSIQSLWTAVQHKVSLTVIILNNGGYGAMRSLGERMQLGPLPGVDITGIEFRAIAEGFGCDALRVRRAEDLPAALRKSFAARRPTVVDIVVDRKISELN